MSFAAALSAEESRRAEKVHGPKEEAEVAEQVTPAALAEGEAACASAPAQDAALEATETPEQIPEIDPAQLRMSWTTFLYK